MGNAALCPSCHAEKSARTRGHVQAVDRALDPCGWDSEASEDLGVQVGVSCRGGRPACVLGLSLLGGGAAVTPGPPPTAARALGLLPPRLPLLLGCGCGLTLGNSCEAVSLI